MAVRCRPLEGWEQDFIRLAYPTETVVKLAKFLQREKSALSYHISRLGLQKPPKIAIGDRFGKLTVVSCYPERRHNSRLWRCVCDCGGETDVKSNTLIIGGTTSCGCYRVEVHSRGGKHIGGRLLGSTMRGAAKRGIEFAVTIEYLDDLFESQGGMCAYTGIPLIAQGIAGVTTASLDRIDSKKGYVVGNVQWVHKDINYMKQDYDEEYFLQMCELVTKGRKSLADAKSSRFNSSGLDEEIRRAVKHSVLPMP